MSTNCINCVTRPRTGGDLLCDECLDDSPFHAHVKNLVNTSVDDMLSGLRNMANSEWNEAVVRAALERCEVHGYKTKAAHCRRWLNRNAVGGARGLAAKRDA